MGVELEGLDAWGIYSGGCGGFALIVMKNGGWVGLMVEVRELVDRGVFFCLVLGGRNQLIALLIVSLDFLEIELFV